VWQLRCQRLDEKLDEVLDAERREAILGLGRLFDL
jgi:hypothetical protein